MQLIEQRCTGCGYCVLVCPYDALTNTGWAKVIPANCTNCNLCVMLAPATALCRSRISLSLMSPSKAEYDVVIIGSAWVG
jgi:electron transfer flavoprotein alpha subunit